MADTMETVKAALQLTAGLAAIGWFLFMVLYRLIVMKRDKVGFLEVDMPGWHEVLFWPIVLGLIAINSWILLS
jgi:hypothetical protein